MPSCQACGRWFSEEDDGCGCDNEMLSFTRKELSQKIARAKREGYTKAIRDAVNELDSPQWTAARWKIQYMKLEVPGE